MLFFFLLFFSGLVQACIGFLTTHENKKNNNNKRDLGKNHWLPKGDLWQKSNF